MIKQLFDKYKYANLATKIRYSYLIIAIPMLVFLVFFFLSMTQGTKRYDDMLNSTMVASRFSQDFKSVFDYETYLLIVGNKSVYSSELDTLLDDASQVVTELKDLTESDENMERLNQAETYLNNLRTYKSRIEENIGKENKYDDNIRIWENDVQIVTELVKETMSEYIYYEISDIKTGREEYQIFYSNILKICLIIFLIMVLVIAFLSYTIPQGITKPVRELSEVTDQIAKGDLSVRSQVDAGAELSNLSDSFNSMIDKINELLDQVTEEQIHLRKAELELLQAQINPHFLYNTLDTIIWLAEGGNNKMVVSMVGSLSDFFRTSLNQGREVISIKEELHHVRSYLEIQQVRYQDILEYSIDVPDSLLSYTIPKITIQPLVENALYHGIKYKRAPGRITITGEQTGDTFCLYVKDDGIGMKPERLTKVMDAIREKAPGQNQIYGLYNVNERIALKFGPEYGINIESEFLSGTTVTIKLPCVRE